VHNPVAAVSVVHDILVGSQMKEWRVPILDQASKKTYPSVIAIGLPWLQRHRPLTYAANPNMLRLQRDQRNPAYFKPRNKRIGSNSEDILFTRRVKKSSDHVLDFATNAAAVKDAMSGSIALHEQRERGYHCCIWDRSV
jgi:hypothetical protein